MPFFLSICALVVASPLLQSSAQPAPQQPATATAAARNATLVAATEEVLKETSELRQLSIIKPVPSSTQSREEIQRAIIKNLDEETSAADLHASEVILKKLGLAPPDFNYRDLMVRLLTEQVAGYYEPKTQQFHLADWIDADGQRPVMAHELTHALQDQHFNLRRFEKWPKGDSDAELAAHSLIEGDATLAMVLYIASNPLRALTFLKSLGSMAGASEELNKAPRAVRESLLFPYQEGLNWTRELYRLGGWSEVSEAFKTLPQSTEQILHPTKYLTREAPVKVVLPDLTVMLNSKRSDVRNQRSVPPASAGGSKPQSSWNRISSDVNGEFGLYLILDEFLKSPAESRRAAAGWGGDRFDLYENAQGQVSYVSVSAWDTENDAREFFDAYVKRVQLQYPNAERTNAAAIVVFGTSDGEVLVALKGLRVFTIGSPQSLKAESLLCALDSNAPNCRPPTAMLFSH
ncbi:MAG TPA: hypothetical protein VNG71_20040 [Pyrinomonadaceae bacterium]|nr:hypothetical protein [Pyrinomonadaceae bacterium]